MRRLRYAALILGVGGLGLLWWTTAHQSIPLVQVGDTTALMNFAYVRMAGTVARDPYVGRTGEAVDYLHFRLDDGTGDVLAVAYRDTARAIVAQNRLPARGDAVEVLGSLDVRPDGRIKLHVRAPEHVVIRDALGSGDAVGPDAQAGGR